MVLLSRLPSSVFVILLLALPPLLTMASTTTSSEEVTSALKTVYFIRHAESEENRRLGSIKTALRDVSQFSLPKAADVTYGLGWLNFPAQIDSEVSPYGEKQIADMAETLKKANFLQGIELVVHSPLKRARDTCKGLLGCIAPDIVVDPVQRVVSLDLLQEKTPAEWINYSSLEKRTKEFENWLGEQPEESICLVGHSQHFKALLNLDFKFGNCDVWKGNFDSQRTSKDSEDKWSNLKQLHACQTTDELVAEPEERSSISEN
jgi:broad specificity phosphatase PhoE